MQSALCVMFGIFRTYGTCHKTVAFLQRSKIIARPGCLTRLALGTTERIPSPESRDPRSGTESIW